MLRLIHAQTVQGGLLIDDIDDGLPNKPTHRLGSTADPKAYRRDGYANEPKQPCYVARTKIKPVVDPTIAGYIDLNETDRVKLSASKGKIKGFQTAGLLSVVSFVASDITVPVLTTADLGTPGVGDLTLSGSKFVSLAPNTSTVYLPGTGGPYTFTFAAIVLGGGTVSDASIFIPAGMIGGLALATSFAQVKADDLLSAVVALS